MDFWSWITSPTTALRFIFDANVQEPSQSRAPLPTSTFYPISCHHTDSSSSAYRYITRSPSYLQITLWESTPFLPFRSKSLTSSPPSIASHECASIPSTNRLTTFLLYTLAHLGLSSCRARFKTE